MVIFVMNKSHYTLLMALLCFNLAVLEALAGIPTIVCLPDMVVSNDLSQCSAIVTFVVSADGSPKPTVTCLPASGSIFPVGTNVVSCTASNHSGLTNCSFRIRVVERIAPQIACPSNITVECAGFRSEE